MKCYKRVCIVYNKVIDMHQEGLISPYLLLETWIAHYYTSALSVLCLVGTSRLEQAEQKSLRVNERTSPSYNIENKTCVEV